MWNNDLVQFARLLCEIVATQDSLDSAELCKSMDLEHDELNELFDRAHEAWEDFKINI